MLGKLLKYDFKALNRVMLPLQGSVLLAGVVACLSLNFFFRSLSNSASVYLAGGSSVSSPNMLPLQEMVNTASVMLAVLFLVMVFASYWVTLFLIGRHFYKNLLRDEGYLSFTLPVTVNKSILSKTIAGSVWLFVNVLILCFVVVLLSLVGFSTEGIVNIWVAEGYLDVLAELSNVPGMVLIFEIIVFAVVATVFCVLQVYVSLAVGAVIARTHKVLAGIGIYVAIYTVMQIITSFLYVGLSVGGADLYERIYYADYSWFYAAQVALLPPLIIFIALSFVFFLLSKHLLKTRLNLD